MITYSIAACMVWTMVAGYELVAREGQAPLGYVKIDGVSAEAFDAKAWEDGALNLVPDFRYPFIAPKFDGAYRNVYAPSAVFTPDEWHVFYGAWDGVDTGNDRIYLRTTTDWLDLDPSRIVIEHGPFIHVCNVNAMQRGDGFELACTVYPDEHGLNKPAYFELDKDGSMITAGPEHIITVDGYPNWEGADVNGMNVIYREGDDLYLYFCDFKNFGKVFRAKQREGRLFDFEGEVFEGRYMVNDVKRFGDTWLMGLHRNGAGLWYTLGDSSDTFGPEQLLLEPLGDEDRFIVSLGFAVVNERVLGVLYGAGPVKELNRNRIFALWLQKRISFTTEDGVAHEVSHGLGPDAALLPLPEGKHTGTLQVWEADGRTPIATLDEVTLVSGRNYTFSKSGPVR